MDKKIKRNKNLKFTSNNKYVECKADAKIKEQTANDCENIQVAQYETLLHETICNNSHFRFKSERNWDEDIKSQSKLNKYFTLDLKLLNEGITTVPFYKRHNYENLYTRLERELIEKRTDIDKHKYKKYLEETYLPKNNKIIINKNAEKLEIEKLKETEVVKPEITIQDNQTNIGYKNKLININEIKSHEVDVNDLLNMKFSEEKVTDDSEIEVKNSLLQSTKIKPLSVPQSTDLEQWLDNILDD